MSTLDFTRITQSDSRTIGWLYNWIVFCSFYSLLFLKRQSFTGANHLALVNDEVTDRVEKSIEKTKGLLSRYFLGLLLQISILLIIYSLVLAFLMLKMPLSLPFFCIAKPHPLFRPHHWWSFNVTSNHE